MATKPKPKPEPEPEPEPEEDTAARTIATVDAEQNSRIAALEERMTALEAEMKEPPIRLGRRA